MERKLELWNYGAIAVERELERLESERELERFELEQDPHAHDQVRCLPFFSFFCVCFV